MRLFYLVFCSVFILMAPGFAKETRFKSLKEADAFIDKRLVESRRLIILGNNVSDLMYMLDQIEALYKERPDRDNKIFDELMTRARGNTQSLHIISEKLTYSLDKRIQRCLVARYKQFGKKGDE